MGRMKNVQFWTKSDAQTITRLFEDAYQRRSIKSAAVLTIAKNSLWSVQNGIPRVLWGEGGEDLTKEHIVNQIHKSTSTPTSAPSSSYSTGCPKNNLCRHPSPHHIFPHPDIHLLTTYSPIPSPHILPTSISSPTISKLWEDVHHPAHAV